MSGSQIPTLVPAAPANGRVYPESVEHETRIDGQAVDGISKQTVTYIPDAAGILETPALELAWWDTRGEASRSATLPAMRLDVAAGAQGSTSTPAVSPASGSSPRTAATAAPTPSGPGGLGLGAALRRLPAGSLWPAGGLVLLVVAVIAALAALRARASPARRPSDSAPPAPTPTSAPTPGKKATLRALRAACAASDRHAAARALMDLGRLEWPDDPPRGLGALAERLQVGAPEIMALDQSLYGSTGSTWDGAALGEAVADGLRPSPVAEPVQGAGLDALYGRHAAGGRAS